MAHALDSARLRVLEGVHLVLSGGLLSDAQQPQRCMYWRLAEAYGAKCHYLMDAKVVTHIVAGPQPSKTVSAWRNDPSKHVVSVSWLLESAARWARPTVRAQVALACHFADFEHLVTSVLGGFVSADARRLEELVADTQDAADPLAVADCVLALSVGTGAGTA